MKVTRMENTQMENASAEQRESQTLRGLLADERGDVPGWVLVTLMTAGLVVLLWAVAGPALQNLFNTALSKVSRI